MYFGKKLLGMQSVFEMETQLLKHAQYVFHSFCCLVSMFVQATKRLASQLKGAGASFGTELLRLLYEAKGYEGPTFNFPDLV